MGPWQTGFIIFCVAGGALLMVTPFLLEYRIGSRLAESAALADAVSQIKNLEQITTQIAGATSQWQSVQEQADKTTGVAREIAQRITDEARAVTEALQKSNDAEKAALRLEVEKLRRAETEWLQVLVRTLDHVYALHQGGVRSGQPNLIQQLENFQNACRDAARRVGVTPFVAEKAEPFDPRKHEPVSSNGTAPPASGAPVIETVAAGYTFQGKLIRPALVRVADPNGQRSDAASPNGFGSESSTDDLSPDRSAFP
ncbi:MAG TPA: nucleotide exchange factor GrpE [Verrucomicrobiae bacterium]|nr:nucleotide exchange factor GrpE [Verrucomicrobiae bacterium]